MSIMPQSKLSEGVAVGISRVDQTGAHTLRIQFSDGFEREVDFSPFLERSTHPQIRAFLDPSRFSQFRVQDGELLWGDYELCFPIADLYDGVF